MKTQAEQGQEFVQHFGVKGMKWGVRKVRGSDSEGRSRFNPDFQKKEGRTTTHDVVNTLFGVAVPIVAPLTIPSQVRLVRKGARALGGDQEARFERKANSFKTVKKIHDSAAKDLNDGLGKINKKYEGVNLNDPKNSAKRRAYDREAKDFMAKTYQKHANAVKSPSGKQQYDVEMRGDDHITFTTRKVKHADGEDSVELMAIRGKGGHIIDVQWADGTMAQGEEFVQDFLEHYGVKGMKWGVRREHARVSTSQARTVTDKAKVKATGGTGHEAHSDAVRVAAKKQRLKKSGVAALSNRELQEVIDRTRLEDQARQAVQSKGRKFVSKKLNTQIDQQGTRFVQREIAKKRRASQ